MEEFVEALNQLNLQIVELAGQGNIEEATILAKQAINIGINQQLTENPAYCDSLNNLAELYRIQGRYSLAEPLYLQTLNLRKGLLEPEHPDIAQSLNNLAALYHSQGKYSEAEKLLLEALELWKGIFGEEHFEIATNLNNLAETYREQGKYFQAEQVHLEVLAMRKRLFGEQHPDIAQTLNNLASIYTLQGRYFDAEKMHLESLSMRTSLFEDDHFEIAVSLNNLARLYNAQGRYLEAETKFSEVLERWKKVLGNEHPYIASTLMNIAGNYQEQGRYQQAEQNYLEALTMRKSLLGEAHPDVASGLGNLAEIYLIQGRYLEAEQKCLEAYSLRKNLFATEHPDLADSLTSLALIYTYQGRYLEAEDKYLQALPMWKSLVGKQHPAIVTALNNMAGLYEEQGHYSEAEQKYLEALELQKSLLGNEHPDISITLNQIAVLYRMQGRYSESEQLHLESLAMTKRLLRERHPYVAAILNNLAVLYHALFDYSQAESLFLEALAIIKNAFGNEHPQVASTMNNLAVIYDFLERYQEAEQLHLETLKLRKSLLGEEHPQIANSLNNLGELYFSLGRFPEAEQKYLDTLTMRKRLLGEEHPDVAFSLNNLATVLAATNRPDESFAYRIQASHINDKVIRNIFAFSSESDRLAFLQKIRNNFDLFLSLVYKHLSTSDSAIQAALDFILKRKGLTASALAAQNQALYSGRYPHLQEKFRQLSELNTRLIHLNFSVPQTDIKGLQEFTTYRENLAQLQSQYNYLQKQLALEVPEIQLAEQTFDRCAIASALPPNSILVEFVRFDLFDFQAISANAQTQWYPSRYLAFILRDGQPDAVQMIDLGETETIDRLIQLFRLEATDNTEPTLAWRKTLRTPALKIKSYNPTPAIELSKALFEPIHNFVKDCKHLIIAPDGNLNLVPFQILPIAPTGTSLLMDEYTISYLSVGREILHTEVQPPARSISPPLIIADPDFDLKAESATDLASDKQNIKTDYYTIADVSRQLIPELLNTFTTETLLRAPGTRLLGESVAKKLQDAQLYLGAEALETRMTSNSCPSVMLIATHGLFLSDSEPQAVNNKRNLLSTEPLRTVKVEINSPQRRIFSYTALSRYVRYISRGFPAFALGISVYLIYLKTAVSWVFPRTSLSR